MRKQFQHTHCLEGKDDLFKSEGKTKPIGELKSYV